MASRNTNAIMMGAVGALLLMALFRAVPAADVTRFVPKLVG